METLLAGASADPRVLAMRREALAAGKRSPWGLTIAAGVLLILTVGALLWRQGEDTGELTTTVGERSSFTLSDGSSVALNTRSRMEMTFTARERLVKLHSGQAWFEVARDSARPFVVEAAGRRITALGTSFDVRVDGGALQVTLVEGRVAVSRDGTKERTELRPGEQLLLTAVTAPQIKRSADVAKVTSWREGQIVFDDDTLAAAIAEVNRYSPTQIVLADPKLAALRVSGVFAAGRSQSFVETVTGHYPIEVVSRSEKRVILGALTESH